MKIEKGIVIADTKVCTKCKKVKPLSEFYKREKCSVDGYRQQCKECIRQIRYTWVENNKERHKEYRHKYYQTTNYRYKSYVDNANRRGLEFNLSLDYVDELIHTDCVYCGSYDNPNGIDRIDNSIGYISGNVQSCCWKCNQAKYTMSEGEFLEHIDKIYNHSIGGIYDH